MQHVNVSLETGRVQTIAETYPEEVREGFMWLCGYILNECNRNTEVLEARVKELKFDVTATSFDRILQGKWNTTPNDEKFTPIVAFKKFNLIIDKLRQQSQLSAMAGKVPFVRTSTTEMIWKYIDARRPADRVNKFGFITGPTGSQKTAAFQQYRLENNHGACVWLEAPAEASLTSFIRSLAEQYGASHNATRPKCEKAVRDAVNKTRTIIVDNVQRLYSKERGGNQPIFGYLQAMQDQTNCTVILSATPDFNRTFTEDEDKGYFEQFVGRCGGRRHFLQVPMWTPEDDLIAIATAFSFKDPEKHLEYLVKMSKEPGRVRVVFGDLQLAKQRADRRKEPLTITHLRAVRGEKEAE